MFDRGRLCAWKCATAVGMMAGGMLVGASGVAFATFPGTTNGDIAFVAVCNPSIGQAIYSVDPNGSPPPTYSCPGGTAPYYSQTTAGAIDSMPYFSATGSTLYFSSSRGAGSNFSIYEVPYPSTLSGSPGSQTDSATQLTFPSDENDYAPTVSSDGTKLAFIRCGAGGSTCSLYVQSAIVGGTPTPVATDVAPAAPDPASGAGDRPEFDPVDSTQIIYVGTDGHIHLMSLTSSFTERDLSAESKIPTGDSDEYPDWNPSGNAIIFDSNEVPSSDTATGGHYVWKLNPTVSPATATAVWGTHDPGTEIEPIFAPEANEYAWTTVGEGDNIQLEMGTSVGSPTVLLTANKTNNSQPAWQPVNLGVGTPEAPNVLWLPAAGLFVGGSGWLALQRRRRYNPRLKRPERSALDADNTIASILVALAAPLLERCRLSPSGRHAGSASGGEDERLSRASSIRQMNGSPSSGFPAKASCWR